MTVLAIIVAILIVGLLCCVRMAGITDRKEEERSRKR